MTIVEQVLGFLWRGEAGEARRLVEWHVDNARKRAQECPLCALREPVVFAHLKELIPPGRENDLKIKLMEPAEKSTLDRRAILLVLETLCESLRVDADEGEA